MRLRAPNLDDRDFHQLVEEAKSVIVKKCPQWTDLSPGDPGIVILELFAHLTETMIYRLNRLPEKAYVEFLRLIGVKLGPPVAASAKLRFSLSKSQDKPVEIPRGTRVTLSRTGGGEPPPVFVVLQTTSIPAGETSVDALAYHCELVEAEFVGTGTGLPGLSVSARRPPIVAATNADLELIVGVEAQPDELTSRLRAIKHDDKAYVVWDEAEDFSNLIDRQFVYVADRITGTITFAPAARLKDKENKLSSTPQPLAEVPKAGRRIQLWYCSGGGLAGNVAANSLTTLKDPIPGVTVTNPDPATGGSDAESLENALVRGPQQLHSLQRAVTARDFELLAKGSSGAVARAKAYTKASLWKHATAGTVEVLIVPDIPEKDRPSGVVTEEALKAHQTDEAIATVRQALDERKPLSTICIVKGVQYKEVKVEARAVIHRGEDAETVEARVLKRLHQTINPLPSSLPSNGWPFGQPLRASHVFDIMLAEPGVSFVDNVHLVVDQVPENNITALAADSFQPNTWYATTHAKLFRSMDDGEGWELIHSFTEDEETSRIRVNNLKAGQVAVITNLTSTGESRLHVSDDCGETWRQVASTPFTINDVAWTSRNGDTVLIMATNSGLLELLLRPGNAPAGLEVDAKRPMTLAFNAVAVGVGVRGTPYVAAAVGSITGTTIYLSTRGGLTKTYEPLGLKDENVRVLEIQQQGGRTFLWAGLSVLPGSGPGKGALRWELQDASAGSPTPVIRGWAGGSCRGLAFNDSFVFAATNDQGVLKLDLKAELASASWEVPLIESGLKIREQENRLFQMITAVAASQPLTSPAIQRRQRIVMAGCAAGIYRSTDNGTNYELCSRKVFLDKVTLSPTSLFCSGEHQIQVDEDEAL
jgi:hypothetical protein